MSFRAFLDSRCPQLHAGSEHVKDALSKETILEKLNEPASNPFASELDYIDSVLALFVLKRKAFLVAEEQERASVQVTQESQLANASELQRFYWDAVALAEQHIASRLKAHESTEKLAPRAVRLARKCQMTEKELLALIYVLICVSEQFKFGVWRQNYNTDGWSYQFHALLRYSGMDLVEGMTALLPTRKHMKDNVFLHGNQYTGLRFGEMVNFNVSMGMTTVHVLCGVKLSNEDLLKLDKTPLAEVLEDEGISAEIAEKADVSGALKNVLAKGDDSAKNPLSDIFEFMRAEVSAEQAVKFGSFQPSVGAAAAFAAALPDGAVDLTAAAPVPQISRRAVSREAAEPDKKDKKAAKNKEDETDPLKLGPYTSNIEYLQDHFSWIAAKIKRQQYRDQEDKDSELAMLRSMHGQTIPSKRELKAKERMLANKCAKRLQMTVEAGTFIPRLERLASRLSLTEFEKDVIVTLCGSTLGHNKLVTMDPYSGIARKDYTVGALLQLFCSGFEDQIKHRSYFYKSSVLVKENIIKLQETWGADLSAIEVSLDRRMLDFIVGLDTELNELVEGSHLYMPTVSIDQVILPEDQKNVIVQHAANFEAFSKARRQLGFEDVIQSTGMLMLFFGKSGTGKTMMANALGSLLKKRILLINYPSLGKMEADLVIKFIFREAKMQDAVLFFDECESIFMSRDKTSGTGINLLLTEIERHNGLIILASNRAFDLDEAMHRRITLAVEFKQPDPILRERIWKAHIPAGMKLDSDINWKHLSLKYELAGGFIKNAILSALSQAVARDPKNIVIKQADIEHGAIHQLRGRLAMVDFERRVVPVKGLDGILIKKEVLDKLQQIATFEKARGVLFGDWGFSSEGFDDIGTTCLFHGPPGTGKTMAAKCIGFETGKPLKIVNCAQLVSKWVGETGKNIDAIFQEAKSLDAILVFDEAEGLFGARGSKTESSTDRYANLDTGLLLYHMERFPGIVILTTNLVENIDKAFFRRFRFIIKFDLPGAEIREQLWKMHLPASAPRAKDVDFHALATKYAFSGGHIKNSCFKAAAKAALRFDQDRIIKMLDLVQCADEELTTETAAPESMFL